MKVSEMPASDPSSAARGVILRIHGATNGCCHDGNELAVFKATRAFVRKVADQCDDGVLGRQARERRFRFSGLRRFEPFACDGKGWVFCVHGFLVGLGYRPATANAATVKRQRAITATAAPAAMVRAMEGGDAGSPGARKIGEPITPSGLYWRNESEPTRRQRRALH